MLLLVREAVWFSLYLADGSNLVNLNLCNYYLLLHIKYLRTTSQKNCSISLFLSVLVQFEKVAHSSQHSPSKPSLQRPVDHIHDSDLLVQQLSSRTSHRWPWYDSTT